MAFPAHLTVATMKRASALLICLLVLSVSLLLSQTPGDSVRLAFRAHAASSPSQFVPGQFNNWGPNNGGVIAAGAPSEMTYDAGLAAWIKIYTFKIHDPSRTPLGDSVYQYKFNSGGTSSGWYADPLNPEQNANDNNNSILRLTRLFWFEYYPTISSGLLDRITIGLVHANDDSVTRIVFSTAPALDAPVTSSEVTGSYNEATRVLDFFLAPSVGEQSYVRLAAYMRNGDSTVFAHGGYAFSYVPIPSYARHGVTLPSAASNDSTTFRLRVPGKPYVLLHIAPLGQPPALAPPILLRQNTGTPDWWTNLKLLPNTTYEYLYEIENGRLIRDPWGRWNGTNGSRFSTGPDGLTADNYVWSSESYVRPPLNRLLIYELNIGEFAGGYFNLPAGQAGFTQMAALMPHFDSLGINAIELMPVNDYGALGKSGFSWGYEINSYFALEPAYGTPEEFKALIDSAHSHGMAVILDVVFNHLSDSSPLWQMRADEAANPYFKLGSDLRPNEDGLLFFKDMDHWTFQTQELIYSVLKMWLDEYHVDGFRYDYTQGIGWDVNQPQYGILNWVNRIHQDYGGAVYQIAEHLPESPALMYYSGLTGGWHDSFRDLVFDEARFQSVGLSDFEDRVLGLGAFSGNDVPATPSVYANRTEPVNANVNHDEQSLIYEMTRFQGVPESTAIVRDKLYGTFIFTSLGIPMLWEGMEYGEPRGWTSDGQKLSYRPVDFSRAGTTTGQLHHAYYRSLVLQRRFNPALYRGVMRVLRKYGTEKVLVWGFEDTLGTAKVMALANLRGVAQTIRAVPWLSTGTWYNIFDGLPFNVGSAPLDSLTLPAYTALVYSNIPETTLVSVPSGTRAEYPRESALAQNYPNPFNPLTTITVHHSRDRRIRGQ